MESEDDGEISTRIGRQIGDKKRERKDEEGKKRNQQKSTENWLHLPFPRGSCSQDREKGRKERRKGAREEQREGQKEGGKERKRARVHTSSIP